MPSTLAELQQMAIERYWKKLEKLGPDEAMAAISVTSCDNNSCNHTKAFAEPDVSHLEAKVE